MGKGKAVKKRPISPPNSTSIPPEPMAVPPRFAEKILAVVTVDTLREPVLGDLSESFQYRVLNQGLSAARRWYWMEALRSGFALYPLKITSYLENMTMRKETIFALTGLLLIIPAAILVTGGLLQSFFGFIWLNNTINFELLFFTPAFILGGILIALLLNLLPLLKVNFSTHEGVLVTKIRLRLQAFNLALVGLVSMMAAIIFLYLLAENFGIF